MGRKAHIRSEAIASRVEKLVAIGAGSVEIAVLTGVPETTLRRHYKAELETGLLKHIEFTYTKLLGEIAAGEVSAIRLFLLTRGKKYGWTERHELTGADGESLVNPVLTFSMPDGGPGMPAGGPVTPEQSDPDA